VSITIARIKSGVTATLKEEGPRVSCCQSVTQPTTELHHQKPCTSQYLSCRCPSVLWLLKM